MPPKKAFQNNKQLAAIPEVAGEKTDHAPAGNGAVGPEDKKGQSQGTGSEQQLAPEKTVAVTAESKVAIPTSRLSLNKATTANVIPERKEIVTPRGLSGLNPEQIVFDTRRNAGTARRQTISISLVDNPSREDPKTTLVGMCIRERSGMRCETYPTQEHIEDVIPHILEIALMHAPSLSDIIITTNHPQLALKQRLNSKTNDFLKRNGCTIKTLRPQPFDMGHTLATLASNGIVSPKHVDYHLYTASLSDGNNSYASALLWGKQRSYYITTTYKDASIITAEARMATWAFREIPEGSVVTIFNASPVMRNVWEKPREAPEELRPYLLEIIKSIKIKDIKFRQQQDHIFGSINRSVRQTVADLYARQDIIADLNSLNPRKNNKR